MEEKRLDFNAPLLSVRRFAGPPRPLPPAVEKPSPPPYIAELKSGPVGNPGLVPFKWEKTPGQPKRAAAPPIAEEPVPTFEDGEVESVYGDAVSDDDEVETLSPSESFFKDCSESGESDSDGPDAAQPAGVDFMMGRFLPAAQAAATGSLQPGSRSQPRPRESARNGNSRRPPIPLPHQHLPSVVSRYPREKEKYESYEEEEEEEEEDYGTGNLSSKACGLIPRFCFPMNPIPGLKVRSQLPPLSGRTIRNANQGILGRIGDEESWEAVYRYKLGSKEYPQREDGSRLTSESNRLTYWTDSQTADESSSFNRSVGGEVSPDRNEERGFLGVPKRELKSWKTNSFDSLEKISESCWGVTQKDGRHRRSSSLSPSVDRAFHADAVHVPQHPKVKLSSVDSEVAGDRVQSCEKDASEPKFYEVVEPNLLSCSERFKVNEADRDGFRKQGSDVCQPSLKVQDQEKSDASLALALLPPPLPTSPSESWLQRTLPSVSLKNPSPQSFLGIQVQHGKQASQKSSKDLKRLIHVKPSRHTISR